LLQTSVGSWRISCFFPSYLLASQGLSAKYRSILVLPAGVELMIEQSTFQASFSGLISAATLRSEAKYGNCEIVSASNA
jgi:hypothetical protein